MGIDGDSWSHKTCKAPVKMLPVPPTNQHPAFYRPDALPVTQPTVPQQWRNISENESWRINETGAVDRKRHKRIAETYWMVIVSAHSSDGNKRLVTSSVTSSEQCSTKLCIAAWKQTNIAKHSTFCHLNTILMIRKNSARQCTTCTVCISPF